MATWSPELLLIHPIRGETETVHLRQDETSFWLQVEDPLIEDQSPFSKFSPKSQRLYTEGQELGTVLK